MFLIRKGWTHLLKHQVDSMRAKIFAHRITSSYFFLICVTIFTLLFLCLNVSLELISSVFNKNYRKSSKCCFAFLRKVSSRNKATSDEHSGETWGMRKRINFGQPRANFPEKIRNNRCHAKYAKKKSIIYKFVQICKRNQS